MRNKKTAFESGNVNIRRKKERGTENDRNENIMMECVTIGWTVHAKTHGVREIIGKDVPYLEVDVGRRRFRTILR